MSDRVTALITGAGGFVGRHLARHLRSLGQEVHGLGRGEAPPDLQQFHRADLLDVAATRRAIAAARPGAVYHLAAQSAVPQSWDDPAGTVVNNLVGQINLLEAVRAEELDPVIVVAISSEVYGLVQPEDNPISEDVPLRPVSPYAVSKAGQDLLAYQYAMGRGMRIVRLRAFNHVGPGQSDRFAIASFARQIAEIERGLRPPVVEVGDLTAERDFSDVRDIVRAYVLAAECGRPGEVYNVGSEAGRRVADVLEGLIGLSTVRVDVQQEVSRLRPADVPRLVCNAARLRSATGWKPMIPFEESLRDVLEDWRARV